MVTNQSADSSDEIGDEAVPRYLSIFRYAFGAVMWLGLAVAVFGGLPRFRRLFEDFDVEISPLTVFVLRFMGPTFVLIAIAAVVALTMTHSRGSRWLILYGIPLALIVLLMLTLGWPLLSLLDDLS
ncbi:hypothetical protein [Thalassoroseus pseudoceratinae]|uniref:hypothetical protein n=1 Tax=Thalassoroseus pseudoceratinae TaxID=2713176 RepID=UPI00142083BC|nr:hypothetical protein [Thalassoroseus pseudoceratinae]